MYVGVICRTCASFVRRPLHPARLQIILEKLDNAKKHLAKFSDNSSSTSYHCSVCELIANAPDEPPPKRTKRRTFAEHAEKKVQSGSKYDFSHEGLNSMQAAARFTDDQIVASSQFFTKRFKDRSYVVEPNLEKFLAQRNTRLAKLLDKDEWPEEGYLTAQAQDSQDSGFC